MEMLNLYVCSDIMRGVVVVGAKGKTTEGGDLEGGGGKGSGEVPI